MSYTHISFSPTLPLAKANTSLPPLVYINGNQSSTTITLGYPSIINIIA